MKRSIFILTLIILCLAASACEKSAATFQMSEQLNEVILKNRPADNQVIEIAPYLYDYKNTKEEIFVVRNNEEQYSNDAIVPKAKAIEDVTYLFKAFKYSYGGYGIFGGDKSFEKARDHIIDTINLHRDDKVYCGDLKSIIINNLSFIRDGHMFIGGERLSDKISKVYFYNQELDFYKTSNGFFTNIKDKAYRLQSVGGSTELDNYLHLSLNPDGDLVYYLGMLELQSFRPFTVDIALERNNKITKKSLHFEKSEDRMSGIEGFKESKIGGIPLIRCTRMYNSYSGDDSMERFAESGKVLKNAPAFVIDIRNNSGGGDYPSTMWYKNYTGDEPSPGIAFAHLYSNAYIDLQIADCSNWPSDKAEEYKKELLRIREEHKLPIWDVYSYRSRNLKNKNKVFVLIDKNVASSGETFVRYMRTLENVVFIGTNTSGAKLVANNFTSFLPNSAMPIYFGHSLVIDEGGPESEGIGYLPDLWLPSDQAANRLEKYIIKYLKDEN